MSLCLLLGVEGIFLYSAIPERLSATPSAQGADRVIPVLLWVRSGHCRARQECLLYRQEQTYRRDRGMAAIRRRSKFPFNWRSRWPLWITNRSRAETAGLIVHKPGVTEIEPAPVGSLGPGVVTSAAQIQEATRARWVRAVRRVCERANCICV